MATTPRMPLVDQTARSAFGAIRGHDGDLSQRFSEMYACFWHQGELDLTTKETVRIRNARITDCGY